MPRAARMVLVDYPLHIVQRGINRNACFFTDRDRLAYLNDLREFSARFSCPVHAYCLMTNHVHLLVTPRAADSAALLMKHLGQCHVQRVNKYFGRTGTLWEGRFRSCIVRSDAYVLACYRYIELNPVRAAIVDRPGDYRWSSHAANSGKAPAGLLKPHAAYESLAESNEDRASSYERLCGEALATPLLEDIRKATRAGCVIGSVRRGKGRPAGQMRKMGSVPI